MVKRGPINLVLQVDVYLSVIKGSVFVGFQGTNNMLLSFTMKVGYFKVVKTPSKTVILTYLVSVAIFQTLEHSCVLSSVDSTSTLQKQQL